ncbi:hypothetical protein ABPG75_006422 [Micractinium tetrahymenae]
MAPGRARASSCAASSSSFAELLLLLSLLVARVAAEHNASEHEPGSAWSAAPAGSEQDLLKCALSHSDPDALRQAAKEARHGAATGDPEFLERQARVQALLHSMKEEPSEAELMQEAVSILANSSAAQEQLLNALQALRYLVEPIDNANNLQGMGGLPPLVAQLAAGQPAALQAAAAHALGTAAANNHQFQAQLVGDHPEVLRLLLALVVRAGEPGDTAGAAGAAGGRADAAAGEPAAGAAGAEAGLKALYALSAILRLNPGARAAFYSAGGVHTLQQLLGSAAGLRAKKKAIALLTDLVHLDAPAMSAAAAATMATQQQHDVTPTAALDYSAAVAAALQLLDVEAQPLQEADLDVQEKALLVLLALLGGAPHAGASATASAAAAAELIRDAGGLATLAQLQAGLLALAAAEEGEGGEGDSYARELWRLA